MSVFSSAFTILFLFWTLTLLMKKLPAFETLDNTVERLTFWKCCCWYFGFCFSDSFWFNAVEAEVYAMATFILSLLLVGWVLGARHEYTAWGSMVTADFFVIGLSFGVHFMGLLTIPAIGMIYYFKNTPKVTFKGFIIANGVSVAVLLFIFKLLLPTNFAFFGNAEVFLSIKWIAF